MPELDRSENSLSQPRSIFPRKFFFQTFVFSLSSVAILSSPSPSFVFHRWGLVWLNWSGRQGTFLPVAFMYILALIPATWCNLSNHGYNIVKAWGCIFSPLLPCSTTLMRILSVPSIRYQACSVDCETFDRHWSNKPKAISLRTYKVILEVCTRY